MWIVVFCKSFFLSIENLCSAAMASFESKKIRNRNYGRDVNSVAAVIAVCIVVVVVIFLHPVGVEGRLPTTQSPRVIETSQGRLRGILVNLAASPGRPGRPLPPVEAYLGLQYATTLGGALRFMPPTATNEKWGGVRLALNFRPVCPQPIVDVERLLLRQSRSGSTLTTITRARLEHLRRLAPFVERQSEDCLNLNIYVPVVGLCFIHMRLFIALIPPFIP